MEDLFTLSYRSVANLSHPVQDIADILQESQHRNAQLGITGLLLYGRQCFMQTLEGTTENVGLVFLKILEDFRHVDLVPFGISALDRRVFPHWRMKLIGPRATARLVPDMSEFDFSDRRLSKIHADVKSMVVQARALH